MIQKLQLYRIVLMSWLFTLMGLFNLFVVTMVVGFVVTRFFGPAMTISIFMPVIVLSVTTFVLSEWIVNRFLGARRADPVTDKAFIEAVKKMKKRSRMWFAPRAYVIDMGVPNAMAYGMGFPLLSAVAVTPQLVQMLNQEELEGVVGHEFAHIRCRDVGVSTVISILHGTVEKCAKLLSSRQLYVVMRSYIVWVVVWVVMYFTKIVFSICRYAISQERELAADALGASYAEHPQHLISALEKLSAYRAQHPSKQKDDGPFSDLMVSHPGIEERIASLRSLLQPVDTKGTNQ